MTDPMQEAVEKYYDDGHKIPPILLPNPEGTYDGRIIFAFDGDDAGRQAALSAIDKYFQTFFDDPELDKQHNPNWVRDGEAYQQFLLDLMASFFTYTHRLNESVDPKQCRRWPLPRLMYVLDCWQQVIYKIVGFGNRPLLEWALPIARECESEIIRELSRRATPKQALAPAASMPAQLRADDVLAKINILSVYEYYLTNTRKAGDELYGVCPHCGGRENWSANLNTGLFRCKSKCGRAGSIFQFVMNVENVSFPIALKRVAELGGMS